MKVLKEYELDNYEDAAGKIYTCALKKYLKENKDFERIFKVMEAQH